jgi:hypothetical protein
MSRKLAFAGLLGLLAVAISAANLQCVVTNTTDGGTIQPGVDGGTVTPMDGGVTEHDGGGEPADGGGVEHDGGGEPADGGGTGEDGGAAADGGEAADGGAAGMGSIALTIDCGGAGCGKMGTIIIEVKADGGVIKMDNSLTGKTLTMGTPIMHTLADVPDGTHSLFVYLDVNTNGTFDTGDVFPAATEVPVIVPAGGSTPITVTLDTIK